MRTGIRALVAIATLALLAFPVAPVGADETAVAGAGVSTGAGTGGRFIVATGQRTGVDDPTSTTDKRVVYVCEAAAGPDSASVTFPSFPNSDNFPPGCRLERLVDDPNNPDPAVKIWEVADIADGKSLPGAASATGVVGETVAFGGAFAWRVCWYAYANYILDGDRVPTQGCSDAGIIPPGTG